MGRLHAVWVVGVLACAPAAPDPTEDSDSRVLASGVFALDGVDDGLPSADLAPFVDLIGDASVIGLGEAVHTSGGILALKRRLIAVLVREHGVRALAMETPRAAARQVTNYLQQRDCSTTAASDALVSGVFPVFVSVDTVALFAELCAWNVAHADDPVSFFGFDNQDPVADDALIRAFVQNNLPADTAAALLDGLSPCVGAAQAIEDDDYARCMDALADIRSATDPLRDDSDAAFEFGLALDSYVSYNLEIHTWGVDDAASYAARDLQMGANLLALRSRYYHDDRMVVWAADYHLSAAHDEATEDTFTGPVATMGTVLADALGDDYAPFAIVAARLGLNWPTGQGDPISTLRFDRGDSVEARLSAFERSPLLVDPAVWAPGETLAIGQNTLHVADNFRGVFFLDRSEPMDAVAW